MQTAQSIIKQYDAMKAKYPDAILLLKVGDNYEMYRDDALKAWYLLGGIISHKPDNSPNGIAYYSFPQYTLDSNLPILGKSGLRVAICDQLENPKLKKAEKNKGIKIWNQMSTPKSEKPHITDSIMSKKKKEDAPEQAHPKSKFEAKSESKDTVKAGQKSEESREHKSREPQMVTVNGAKVTHAHAYQASDGSDHWFFTAKLDGVQLRPQWMTKEDVEAYQSKDGKLTVEELMRHYYPTKLQPKVPDVAFTTPNVIVGNNGPLTVEKFNVYKEKNPDSVDFDKWMFYAQIGDKKMSAPGTKDTLNAYFDRTMTPGHIAEQVFGSRLHLKSYYEQFKLPEGIDKSSIKITKEKDEDRWKISVDFGDKGQTSRVPLSFHDGVSYFKEHTASKEQLAAKYLLPEISKFMTMQPAEQVKSSLKI